MEVDEWRFLFLKREQDRHKYHRVMAIIIDLERLVLASQIHVTVTKPIGCITFHALPTTVQWTDMHLITTHAAMWVVSYRPILSVLGCVLFSVCQDDNSWTVGDTIMKFVWKQDMVKNSHKFDTLLRFNVSGVLIWYSSRDIVAVTILDICL